MLITDETDYTDQALSKIGKDKELSQNMELKTIRLKGENMPAQGIALGKFHE